MRFITKHIEMETEDNQQRLKRIVFRIRLASLVLIGLGVWGGLAIARVGIRQTWNAWQSPGWRTTSGVITASSMSASTRTSSIDDPLQRDRGLRQEVTKDVWIPQVTFSFELNGKKYEGHRISVGDVPSDSHSGADEIVKRYQEGAPVRVFVDPSNPTESILQPGITFGAVGPLIIGTVVCFCMACLAYGVMSKKLASLVEVCCRPPGTYLVGKDGQLMPVKHKRHNVDR